ncbi:sigma-70 family RNA polymerase sigma factor [Polaribacter litorisediminis]|uniref:RNA polymerase sigma factor n=1 Tax=Polaribacter litorisediminis TaxID=1908341 RepID=UPI001CBBE4BD|nr:sigma-70 family RNA polymerase sigma factor [Polaribacter litorisediminis]UAM98084.1 sigma-70 family RNA polymerase sigma factor [Polaribacter litorisediminis]
MSKEINFLVLESKKGKQKAQIQLYDLYCNAMFTISCRYLKNEEEAKDAMQDGFLKAFLNLNNYDMTTNFSAWLKTIIINTCIDKLKKKKLETVSLEKYPLEISNDEDWNFDPKISKQQIIEAIEKIDLKYQLVIKLYLMEGYDHQEIASILKIPIKTSRTHLRRGKLALRNLLKVEKYGT